MCQLDNWVMRILGKIGRPLLFGGYDRTSNPHQEYNAFFMLTPHQDKDVGDLQVYRKNILLPFGEFIPGADLIPWVKRQFPQVGYFGRGNGPEVFSVELKSQSPESIIRFNPIICYEALFPGFIRQAALNGSQFILNITNDSWFGPWGEPYLHLALSTFRGIEVRLPQVRSTNTGISVLVDSRGQIIQRMGVGKRGYLNVSVPLHQPIWTLYKAWGDWFSPLCILLSLLFTFPLMKSHLLRKP